MIGRLRSLLSYKSYESFQATPDKLNSKIDDLHLGWLGAGIGMWHWDITNNKKKYSDKFKELLGYKPDEFGTSYESWSDRLHEEDKQRVIASLNSHIENKTPYDVEYRLITKSNQWRWFRARGQAVWDDNDIPLRMAGSLDDITHLKWQEQALKSSEENFRLAMRNAPIGMAIVDRKGRLLLVNPALCNLFGYNENELLLTDFQLITHPDDLDQDVEYINNILEGTIPYYQIEKRYLHKNGNIIWALSTVSLVRESNGSPKYFISQIQDITQKKDMKRMKRDFISTVSHELRTPLTSIRGSLDLITGIMSSEIPEGANRLIEIARNNCERLILLVNDILDIDKINSGKMRFEMKEENVALLLKSSVEANTSYAEKFKVDLYLQEIDNSLVIKVDSSRFIQVLSNLLSNAIKFSYQNDKVEISASSSGTTIRISVIDKGPGIPKEFQESIFDKFTQADQSVARKQDGTGLGLHITKQIVEKMNGNIGFYTEVGKGTTFWIEFPAVRSQSITDSAKDLLVLICEDSPDSALIMQMMLKRKNIKSDIANNLKEARSLLGKNKYHVLTQDIHVHEDNGIDFINELRQKQETASLPVIILSGDKPDGKAMKELGISAWLLKPIDQDDFINSIITAAEAYTMSSENG